MKAHEIRRRFLEFFKENDHAILNSASLVTQDEKGVTNATLFNTAGVQPLIPYILQGDHPKGSRLASAQKCVRTVDLEEVGDNTHLTFFEMLGNWSIGDYFKKEAIQWSFEFLTSKEKGIGLDPKRIYVTVFEGNHDAPRDTESYEIWKEIFESIGLDPEKRIFFMPAENNWWDAGDNGPCGPDTEMFYDLTGKHTEGLTKEEYIQADDAQEIIEVWNDVFMEFEKKDGKVIGKLPKQNVDTGSGLERLAAVVQGKTNVYETDIFNKPLEIIGLESDPNKERDEKEARIVLDHLRASLFMITDGVEPSNTDRGYVLRRILRRAFLSIYKLHLDKEEITDIIEHFIGYYKKEYPEIEKSNWLDVIREEEETFKITLKKGLKEIEKGEHDAFTLFTTYGFPFEMSRELIAQRSGELISKKEFEQKMQEHQELSRKGAEQKFKGGLADHNTETVRLHTAHHLVLAALQKLVSGDIHQKGSNITGERLRIDFNFDRKLTDEEKQAIEEQVNQWIQQGLQVVKRIMPREEAEKIGAEMEFGATYPDEVSVYFIEDKEGNAISKEFCGGPHVEHLGELGVFKIKKEESSSQGVRRIKAILKQG